MVAGTLLQTGASSDDPYNSDAYTPPSHPYLLTQVMQNCRI